MTPERLAEIRRIEYHKYGMSGLVAEELINEVDTLLAENDRLKGEVERLMANKWLFIPEEDVCKKCSGIGRRAYSSTATWRGGIGGQAITEDVCDSCWGTGRVDRKGFDIRKFGAEMKSLRTRLQSLVEAVKDIADTNYTFVSGKCEVTYSKIWTLRKALTSAVQQARELGKKPNDLTK